jgi:hypothetical protein
METRDILNYQGNVIGQLTLPDETSDRDWSNALAAYSQPPTPIKVIVENKIKDYKKSAIDLIDAFKADNTLAGISVAQSAQMFDDFGDVLTMLREGALPTALYRLSQKSPSGFVTQDIINSWIAQIKACL